MSGLNSTPEVRLSLFIVDLDSFGAAVWNLRLVTAAVSATIMHFPLGSKGYSVGFEVSIQVET